MPTVVYRPLPTAEKVHNDPKEIQAVFGPWGCGKSTIAIYDLFFHVRKYNCDALVVRETYPSLNDSCLKDFLEVFAQAGDINLAPPPTFTWRLEGMNGRKVMFRAAQNVEDLQKFGSVHAGYVWIEEMCPGIMTSGQTYQGIPQEVFAALFARIRQKGVPRRMIITSLPPPTRQHWTYKLFYEKKPMVESEDVDASTLVDAISLHVITPEENKANLPKGYYDSLRLLLKSEDQIARFLNGQVGSGYGGAAIYPTWDDSHIRPNLKPEPGDMLRGWDGGLTPTCVWMQLTNSGRLLVLAELQGEDMGIDEFAPVVIAKGNELFGPRRYRDFADPSMLYRSQNNAKSCQDYLIPFGIHLLPSPQDPTVRIGAVRSWLSRKGKDGPMFQIHPRCEMLIEGFRGAYRQKVVAGIPTGKAEKNEYSHYHDALQYAVSSLSNTAVPAQKWPKELRTDFLGRFPGVGRMVQGLSRYTRHPRSVE
jgi:hypothetical protein